MSKDFKKFLTESELKLDPSMRVGDTLRLNINAKEIVEMTITNIEDGKITVEDSSNKSPMFQALSSLESVHGVPGEGWEQVKSGAYDEAYRYDDNEGGFYTPDVTVGRKGDMYHVEYEDDSGMKSKEFNSIEDTIRFVSEITDLQQGMGEGAKPDYLDFDKDGDKDEPMKKALKDKEEDVSEGSASSIASRIKSLIDSGATVDSQAAGRVGKIINVDGDFVSIRTVTGKKGVTRFDSGDEVKLFKRKDGTYVVRNTGAGASEWGFGPGKGDQSVDEAAKPAMDLDSLIDKIDTYLLSNLRSARYKSVDFDKNKKTLYWVTQETYDSESSQAAANVIAKMLKKNGYAGWTVKVVVRDEYRGPKSPWQVAVAESEQGMGEGAKPDYLDFDKDGNKDEPMKKALKDKEDKVNEADSDMSDTLRQIVQNEDYDELYNLLNADTPAGHYVKDLYNEIASQHHLAVDDDYDQIVDRIMDNLRDDYGSNTNEAINDILKLSGVKPVKADEAMTGKPEHKHVGGAGMGGGYSATEDEATTQHQLGSHKYIARTEVDGDGDQYYTIDKIVNGTPVQVYNQMQDMEPDVNTEPMVAKKILADHMKATAHMFDGDEEDEDMYENKGLFATILKNAGLKPVTEADLNGKHHLNEGWDDYEQYDTTEAARNAIIRRIKMQHMDLIDQYGIKNVMDSVNDQSSTLYNLDEIGSSDVSAWVNNIIDDLERATGKKYKPEGKSFELREGKIVVDNQQFDLKLNNANRTWTANIWTTKKVF